MENKVSIILCSYNEVKYIENTIYQLEKHIPNLELVIVDDSSNDGTIELLKKLNTNNRFKLIFRKKSKGLASAFSRGLIETTGNYIGWIDTNMGEVSIKFTDMINELNNNSDVVILSRYVSGGGDERIPLRSLGSKIFNTFCRLLFRIPTKDLTSSIFLMKRSILDEITFLCYGHGEFFLEFLYNTHKKGFKIKEIPYVQKKDENDSDSKSAPNLVKFFFHGIMYVLRAFVTIVRRKN
tara:strand:+ start:2661 stop:3374 length:714 start_codon:yes stop_codon:yes gene_type:complete